MYIEIKTKLLNDMCYPMLSPIFANHSPPLFLWQDKLQRCSGGRSLGGGGKSPGDGPAETCRCGCRDPMGIRSCPCKLSQNMET